MRRCVRCTRGRVGRRCRPRRHRTWTSTTRLMHPRMMSRVGEETDVRRIGGGVRSRIGRYRAPTSYVRHRRARTRRDRRSTSLQGVRARRGSAASSRVRGAFRVQLVGRKIAVGTDTKQAKSRAKSDMCAISSWRERRSDNLPISGRGVSSEAPWQTPRARDRGRRGGGFRL